jgi:hypothetical protein
MEVQSFKASQTVFEQNYDRRTQLCSFYPTIKKEHFTLNFEGNKFFAIGLSKQLPL